MQHWNTRMGTRGRKEKHLTYWCLVLMGGLLLWGLPIFSAPPVLAAVEVGSPAPEFCLPTQDGKSVCLKDFKGKQNVLLLFYILDFTPG